MTEKEKMAWYHAVRTDYFGHGYNSPVEDFARCQKDAKNGNKDAIELIRLYTQYRLQGE